MMKEKKYNWLNGIESYAATWTWHKVIIIFQRNCVECNADKLYVFTGL